MALGFASLLKRIQSSWLGKPYLFMIYRPLITLFGHNLLDAFQSDFCQTFQFSPIIQKSHVHLDLITTAADELYSNSFT